MKLSLALWGASGLSTSPSCIAAPSSRAHRCCRLSYSTVLLASRCQEQPKKFSGLWVTLYTHIVTHSALHLSDPRKFHRWVYLTRLLKLRAPLEGYLERRLSFFCDRRDSRWLYGNAVVLARIKRFHQERTPACGSDVHDDAVR